MKKLIFVVLMAVGVLRVSATGPVTITVSPTATDGATGSLRAAIATANGDSTAGDFPYTIILPAGTYTLSSGVLAAGKKSSNNGNEGLGSGLGNNIVFVGAGAATTIITQSDGVNRVFNLDADLAGGATYAFSGVTIAGGNDTFNDIYADIGLGGGGIFMGDQGLGGTADNLFLTNCVFANNKSACSDAPEGCGGAAVEMQGGSIYMTGCVFTNNAVNRPSIHVAADLFGGAVSLQGIDTGDTLTAVGCVFLNNSVTSPTTVSGHPTDNEQGQGGAVGLYSIESGGDTGAATTLYMTNCFFLGNSVTANKTSSGSIGGGAMYVGGTAYVIGCAFLTNSANGSANLGGAISIGGKTSGGDGSAAFSFTAKYCLFVGNSVASGGSGSQIYAQGSASLTDCWWGTNSAPSTTLATTTSGTLTNSPYLELSVTAASGSVTSGGTDTLTASFLTDSGANTLSAANLGALTNLTATFSGTDGTVSPTSTNIQSTATATSVYTGTTVGSGTASVTVDAQTVSVSGGITVNSAATTVVSVTTTPTNMFYKAGLTVPIKVSFSGVETVTGTPQLALNDGGTANYTSGSGTTNLVFDYVVAAGDNTEHLEYASTSALTLNGGTISSGGNAATLTLPTPGAAGSLSANTTNVIDTIPPVLTISAPTTFLTRKGPVNFTVTWTDTNIKSSSIALTAVTVFNNTHKTGSALVTSLTVSNAVNKTGFSVGQVNFTTLSGTGTISFTIPTNSVIDLASNSAPSAVSMTFVVNNTPPAITIGAPSVTSVAAGGSVSYEVSYFSTNFSSATLTAANITLTNTAVTGTVTVTTNNATNFTVTIANVQGAGSQAITIATNTASDILGNTATAAGPSANFTIIPVVTGVTPSSGPPAGGTSVTITGTGFVSGATVKFGTTAATGVTVNSATSMTATSPSGSGVVDVTVSFAGLTSATSSADQFTYQNPVPMITAQPANSVATVGQPASVAVTATGTGLGYQWFKDGVWLTGQTSSTLSIASFQFQDSGLYRVVVTNGSGMAISLPAYLTVTNATLLAWGDNNDGQLGIGTTNNSRTPVVVASNVVAVAAGGFHSMFVDSAGTLWTMGLAASGQLGNGSSVNSSTPVSVASNVVAVAAGGFHSMFVDTNGVLWGFGYGFSGELGDGAAQSYGTPVSVASNVVAVAAGSMYTMFIKNDGTLWSMGDNFDGDLGVGTMTQSNSPSFVASNVVAVTAASASSLFLTGDQTLWAVGYNGEGDFGIGPYPNSSSPVSVASNVVAAAMGGTAHTLFVDNTGTLWAAGDNQAGDLGVGTTTQSNFAVMVTTNVSSVGAGIGFSLFVKTDGTLWSMGDNTYGELGIGTGVNSSVPVMLSSISAASLGQMGEAMHSLAVAQYAAPAVTGILPGAGPTAGGTVVTITGTGFASGATVQFGSAPGTSVTFNSATSITATSPTESAGTVDVTVTTPGGASATSGADQFTYDAVPAVTVVSPSAGPTAGGTSVTITGTGFVTGATVNFGSTVATGVTVNSATSITATSPAGSGVVDVTVTTPGGTSATSGADQFAYDAVPTVTAVGPSAGPTAGGTSVTITGTGFITGATVNFGTTAGTGVTVSSATSITVTAPAGFGAVDVTVTTPGGTSATSGADQFTYVAAPTVTGVSPVVGPTAGGTSVAVTGTGFASGATVNFGVTAGTGVTVNSATSITVTSPAGAAGTVDVTVTTTGGTSATSSADQYRYTAAPIITAGPTNSVVGLGQSASLAVTVEGSGLAYQWFKDGVWLTGQTGSSLSIASFQFTDGGMYHVVVTNGSGMAISLPAYLTVTNATLLGWGENINGELGNPALGSYAATPEGVATNVVATASGSTFSLYITSDGTLWAMGQNTYGQLGNGTVASEAYPVSVASNVVAVAAGNQHSLFIDTNGVLWGMGYNGDGELGTGNNAPSLTPVSVASNVVAVAAGYSHSMFIKGDGSLWTVGDNSYGQLGNGTTTGSLVPLNVASNVVEVAAGQFFSLFVTGDQTLRAMGDDDFGVLGNGKIEFSESLPVSVASNVVAVAAGAGHALFVDNTGTLRALGVNNDGQLGDGTYMTRSNAVIVAGNVAAVAAGATHSLFVKNDGSLWAMGDNFAFQSGNGVNGFTNIPVKLTNVFVASLGAMDQALHSLAVAQIVIPPAAVAVTSTPASNYYRAGQAVAITVTFNEPVTVTGAPQLALADGGTAVYASGSGTTNLVFDYTVGAGDASAHLDYASTSALSLNGGTVSSNATAANLTLATPGTSGSLSANTLIVVDTTAPMPTISAPSSILAFDAGSISFTVSYFDLNFSNATLSAANVSLTNPAVTATITVATNNATNYTVTVSGLLGVGPQAIQIASGTAADLAGNSAPAAGPSGAFNVTAGATHFAVSMPATAQSGIPFKGTVTALDYLNGLADRYSGTLYFTSTDGSAILPGDVTLFDGVGTFTFTLKSIGSRTITATDAATPSLTGTSSNIAVTTQPLGLGIYVSDDANSTISKVTTNGVVSTLGGGFTGPEGLAFDAFGNLYVANYGGSTVSKVSTNGVVTIFASGFNQPQSLAFDQSGNLYVANYSAGKISKVTPGGVVSTFVTGLNTPDGLAVDDFGNLYISSANLGTVTQVTPGGGAATYVSGLGGPSGLAFDRAGNLYVSNVGRGTVSRVTTNGVVTTYASGFSAPGGLAFDGFGNLYVVNIAGNTVAMVATNGVVSTFASGFSTPVGITIQNPAARLQILLPGETNAPNTFAGKTGSPVSQAAGAQFSVTVNAVDGNFNIVSEAAPKVALTSSDSGAALPANASLVNGTLTFGVTLATAGSQTVTVTDTAGSNPLAPATSSMVTVAAATPSSSVTGVTSSPATGYYGPGGTMPVTVTFSAAVTVTGTPQLALSDGGTAVYASGSGTATLTFDYTPATGENTAHLDYASVGALSLNGGTITAAGTPADVVLPAPSSVGSLGANTTVVIDTTPPTVTISAPSAVAVTNGPNSSISFTVTWFDANFAGATLTAASVSLTNPSVTGTILVSEVNSTNYTVTLTNLAGLGSQAIQIALGTATDLAGNAAGAAGPSAIFDVMTVPLFYEDSVIANRSSYLQAGEVLLVRTNGTQELLTTELYDPYDTCFDLNGDMLVACYQTPTGDYNTNAAVDGGIFKIDQHSLALSEVSGYTNFVTPFGVAVEPDGHILVADLDANTLGTIYRVDPVTGEAVELSANGGARGTNFYWLAGIAVATNGGTETIYVADHGDGATIQPKVIAVDPVTGAQTVVVEGAPLQNPGGLAVDPSGGSATNIYVADRLAGTLIQLGNTAGGWTMTALTTTPANTMQLPTNVAIDPVTGDLFVTDGLLPTVGNPVAGALWRIRPGTFQIDSISSGGFFEQPRGLGVRH